MGTEDKTLFCFCHWGKKNKVQPDGSVSYMGGITGQVILKTGIKYNDFVSAIFGQLGIDPSDKILHFTVKFDRSELIRLRDQEDVNALLQFNDSFAHVYVSSLEEEPNSGLPSGGAEKPELVDSDVESDTIPNPVIIDYPDPEFSDFDKHKAENCFAFDQVWACYDTADGMPRFYVHIRKVFSPEFNIIFNWLEAHPGDQRERTWVKADLPVGCGKFRCGIAEFTSDRLIFSNQVQCEKGETGLYIVYPKKGETWALFKDWDIRWSLDPENHRKYKYEVVEILSDYVGDVGIQVRYLDKVTGFVSLYQQTRLTVVGTFFVKPKELYKFSHRIPSFKMTGTEGEGVAAGSFELDPASLPIYPDDVWYPGKVMDGRTANSQPLETGLFAVAPGTENAMTSLKSGDLGIHATDGDSAMLIDLELKL